MFAILNELFMKFEFLTPDPKVLAAAAGAIADSVDKLIQARIRARSRRIAAALGSTMTSVFANAVPLQNAIARCLNWDS